MRRFVIAALVTLTLASCADQNAYRVASDQQRHYRTDLESYQPIRVFIRANEALAIVHGMETWEHRIGPSTSGEFRTVLSLKRGDRGWTVVRTDEQTMGERPPTDPPVAR